MIINRTGNGRIRRGLVSTSLHNQFIFGCFDSRSPTKNQLASHQTLAQWPNMRPKTTDTSCCLTYHDYPKASTGMIVAPRQSWSYYPRANVQCEVHAQMLYINRTPEWQSVFGFTMIRNDKGKTQDFVEARSHWEFFGYPKICIFFLEKKPNFFSIRWRRNPPTFYTFEWHENWYLGWLLGPETPRARPSAKSDWSHGTDCFATAGKN
jgi:hypothetical protein